VLLSGLPVEGFSHKDLTTARRRNAFATHPDKKKASTSDDFVESQDRFKRIEDACLKNMTKEFEYEGEEDIFFSFPLLGGNEGILFSFPAEGVVRVVVSGVTYRISGPALFLTIFNQMIEPPKYGPKRSNEERDTQMNEAITMANAFDDSAARMAIDKFVTIYASKVSKKSKRSSLVTSASYAFTAAAIVCAGVWYSKHSEADVSKSLAKNEEIFREVRKNAIELFEKDLKLCKRDDPTFFVRPTGSAVETLANIEAHKPTYNKQRDNVYALSSGDGKKVLSYVNGTKAGGDTFCKKAYALSNIPDEDVSTFVQEYMGVPEDPMVQCVAMAANIAGFVVGAIALKVGWNGGREQTRRIAMEKATLLKSGTAEHDEDEKGAL
jgi:hypothetical protein